MNTGENILIPFLRNLADSLESKSLLPTQLQKIGQFFMSYQQNEQRESESESESESEDEMIKFFVLGWYIYNHLLETEE